MAGNVKESTKGTPILPQTTGAPRETARPLSRPATAIVRDDGLRIQRRYAPDEERQLDALARLYEAAIRAARSAEAEGQEKAATCGQAVAAGASGDVFRALEGRHG